MYKDFPYPIIDPSLLYSSFLILVAMTSTRLAASQENGARFQKHVDNPNRDGRVLTSIVRWRTEGTAVAVVGGWPQASAVAGRQ